MIAMGKKEKVQLEELDKLLSHRDQMIMSWRQLVNLGRKIEEQVAVLEQDVSLKEAEEAQ